MSTQKERVHYRLYHDIAQRACHLARFTDIPTPSVRRILAELVKAGRAKFTRKDVWGFSGYVAMTKRGVRVP